jgi:hypothetical protein
MKCWLTIIVRGDQIGCIFKECAISVSGLREKFQCEEAGGKIAVSGLAEIESKASISRPQKASASLWLARLEMTGAICRPRGGRAPRALRALAISLRVSAPAFRIAWVVIRFVANSSASCAWAMRPIEPAIQRFVGLPSFAALAFFACRAGVVRSDISRRSFFGRSTASVPTDGRLLAL